MFGSWFFGSGPSFLPPEGQLWGPCGAETLCRGLCCCLRGSDAGGEGRGAQDAAAGRSMLIPLSALQSRNRPEGRGQQRGVKSGWFPGASVPRCSRMILKEAQRGILNFQGAVVEGKARVSGGHGLCLSLKPHQEGGNKRIFFVNLLLCELHPLRASTFTPGASPRISLLIFPLHVITLRDKTIPGAALPTVSLSPPWDQTLPKMRGKTFSGFLLADFPRGGCRWMRFCPAWLKFGSARRGRDQPRRSPGEQQQLRADPERPPGTSGWQRARSAGLGGIINLMGEKIAARGWE